MVMNKASISKIKLNKSSGNIPTLKNTLHVTLEQLRPNYVTLNKEVIWTASWMGNQQESSPIHLKNPNDHIEESIAIDLNIDFSFSIETSFTPSYLNNIINKPVLISACESSAGKSVTKASGKVAGDVLGQCCLDILPLFTSPKNVTSKTSETSKKSEDSGDMFNSDDQPRKSSVSLSQQSSPVENVNQVKVRNEITADLTLEAKEMLLGSALLTPMNKMNLVVSASLSLESPIPEELASTNILTLTVETAYNFPPPLCEPEYDFTSLRYSLAVILPLDAGTSQASLDMGLGKPKKSFSTNSSDIADVPHQETTNNMKIIFSNSHPGTHPDKTFRVKWKYMEDVIAGRAKYSSRQVPKHTRDVKYGETVRLVAEGKNHVQWNQMERVWLTENTEDMIRQHVEMYGMWPVEIKIEAAPVADKKKEKSNKSFITTGGNLVKGPKPVDTSGVTLPIHQLALVELSDLLYPGLTQSRVLATFIPNPTEEILRCRTGMEKLAYTIGADAQNVSTISTNTGKKRSDAPINSDDPIKDIKTVKSLFQVGGPVPPAFVEKPEKPSEEYATDVNENFPADPFCIIVHLEFSRALTEKPEQETLLLELNNVINVKQLYKPDPSRRAEKKTLDQFEKAIAKVSHMFYAEYEDYVKLRTRVEHDTMDKSKTMLDNEKTNKTRTEPTNETEAVEQPWNNLSETRTCDTTHANKHKLRSNQTVNNNEPDMEAFGDQCRISKTENDSTSHELLALPQIHISIPVDFREYLIRSGSLAKAFTLLELPLREYICFYYKPDGNETHLGVDYMTLYSMEVLADIHAQVVQLMSKIVENVANALPAQGVRCARNDMLRTLLQTETDDDTAACLANQLAYAMQYQEEGYTREAEQLLVSRIQNVKKSNSNNACVWEDYGRFCLGEGRLEEARVSLEQSLFLSPSQGTLMMLGYVSYRLNQLDQADFYLTLLTSLYDSSVEVWTTLGVYYTLTGKPIQARTVFHIAHTLLADDETGGQSKSSNSKSGNGLRAHSMSTGSASKSNGEQNENSSFASNDLTILLHTEHAWLDPTPYCFQGETHGNSKFLKSCPLLLTLNMFEFAETCIGEHLLQLNRSSALAAYYYAVSHYKQGHYHAGLSHLNDIPNPLSKCIPVLVLKFHCACAMNSAQIREKYGPDASKLDVTTSAESFSSDSKTENVYLATNLNETSSRLKNQSKNTLKKSNNITNESNHTANSSSDPCAPYYTKDPSRDRDFNAKQRYGQNDWNLVPSLTQCQQYYKSMQWEVEAYDKLKWFVLMRLGRISTTEEVESEMLNQIHKSNRFENISPEKQTRKSKMISTYDNIESEIRRKNSTGISSVQEIESEQLLTDAEQYLLRLINHHITPLTWYYLGLVYIKMDQLTQAELVLNEANKLDPEFGDAWASLALVNFRMRHLSLFENCLAQARKYKANSRLLKGLESLVPLL